MKPARYGCVGMLLISASVAARGQSNTCSTSREAVIDSQLTLIQHSADSVAKRYPDSRVRKGWKDKPRIMPMVSYSQTQLPAGRVRAIKAALEHCEFNNALKLFFGAVRDPNLPDWVVYIPKNGEARHALIRGEDSTGAYRSEHYVWAIVFAESSDGLVLVDTVKAKANAPPAPPPAGDVMFRRRLVKYQTDPLLIAALRFVTFKFGGQAVEVAAAKDSNDASPNVYLTELSASDSASLYVGTGRHGLVDNAQVVLSLHAEGGHKFPGKLRDLYANLVNSSASRWEFGLATGTSYQPHARRLATIGATGADSVKVSSKFKANVLLTTYFNVCQPHLPISFRSCGLVAGTGAQSPLDDLLIGVAGTTFKGKVGLVAGAIYEKEVSVSRITGGFEKREERKRRAWFGLDLRL